MRRFSIYLIAIIFFSSCEKVIDLKLDKTEPKVVIESIFTDLSMRHSVFLSRTSNFDADNTKIPISGATVILKDTRGTSITFVEQTPGVYTSNRTRGFSGVQYTLTVTVEGKSYAATSVMPYAVPLKSFDQVDLSFFGESRKSVQLTYADPPGFANFYYTRVFVNNVKRNTFYVESDRFNNGREVKNSIYIDEPDLVTGDVVRVQFLTIDENVYKYLFSITQISGNGGPPTTPGNPTSNFSNGALGFFSASSIAESGSLAIK